MLSLFLSQVNPKRKEMCMTSNFDLLPETTHLSYGYGCIKGWGMGEEIPHADLFTVELGKDSLGQPLPNFRSLFPKQGDLLWFPGQPETLPEGKGSITRHFYALFQGAALYLFQRTSHSGLRDELRSTSLEALPDWVRDLLQPAFEE
jgi:hypothetical protein